MKIFYGVQATGNGHISRARAMAPYLREAGMEVDFFFSGRDPDRYFDMEIFGDYTTKKGITYKTSKGKILYADTVFKNNYVYLARDIGELDVSAYDLVVTDFEPISAWAGKVAQKKVIGISHQNSFLYKIPQARYTFPEQFVLQSLAPADIQIGLHWHHFGQNILPPIAPVSFEPTLEEDVILVYLPFESMGGIQKLLKKFKHHNFYVYHPEAKDKRDTHIHWRKPSREAFQKDLARCDGVICNCGFTFISEALQLGKRVLSRPVAGQTEQKSNAIALRKLGFVETMNTLCEDTMRNWLQRSKPIQVRYPNVAKILTNWIVDGCPELNESFFEDVWSQVVFPDKFSYEVDN